MYEISQGICFIYLLILSFIDIKSRKIPVWTLIIGMMLSVIFQYMTGNTDYILVVLGGIIGAVFIITSKATKEKFGYGDSILIFILGIFLGFWNILYLLFIAFFVSAVYSIILLSIFRKGKKESFPFIPFLTIGYLGGVLFGKF
ncbi:A24 family peptidase [Faecalicatena acetigenes]|uniref:A24 family peptidase n=1 Tax=Faecalicatena acetigenes TaxID=2981790 RepID=A0ABT2TFE0_9FIRM|nr:MULTISPECIES: A24 family peptidase [Lachnospiraceae]MCU6748389.1 A24 family peptidase [Faecalicatena acetigenes]SCI41199.1 Flp pilus assembly protein%2C protease CpaA [uncultured Clostridium sp.]